MSVQIPETGGLLIRVIISKCSRTLVTAVLAIMIGILRVAVIITKTMKQNIAERVLNVSLDSE